MGQERQPTAAGPAKLARADDACPQSDAARKRAAVEIVARHEASLKRTARRFSLDLADAEDAYQRALEIVLTKAPTTDLRELIRWTQTVVRHEAMAVREGRERLLGAGRGGATFDPVALLPARVDGPDEQAERREAIARSREALQALKPDELQALTLRAEGYSYEEIGELTGFSQTKINRVLVEGRERFRELVASSEDGTRCRQLRPLLSAFCDGETSPAEGEIVREHLRACAGCRSTMRAYREAPRIVLGLAPLVPLWRSLLGRLHGLFAGSGSQLPGAAGTAKLLAVCAGVAGGACVATGVVPTPLDLSLQHPATPTIERSVAKPLNDESRDAVDPTHPEHPSSPPLRHEAEPEPAVEEAVVETEPAAAEYEAPPPTPEPAPAPPPPPAPAPAPSSESSGSAAGEFGP